MDVRPGPAGGAFHGAKLALFIGEGLLVYLRDETPCIPWPGFWDLPGGGREGAESPVECVLRETHEEFGLSLAGDDLVYSRAEHASPGAGEASWFFAAHLPAAAGRQVRFGTEGQCWRLVKPAAYLRHLRAVPHLSARLRTYLAWRAQAQGA
jgi:8-oxo-dGTP diphosphatase